MTVEWPKDWRIINDSFIPLIDNTDRYLILWGGRGSSKSDFTAKKLIYRCITEKYLLAARSLNRLWKLDQNSFEVFVLRIRFLKQGIIY